MVVRGNAAALTRDDAGRSAVTQFGAELHGTGHEGSAAASDFFAAAVEEDAFGDVEPFRTADDLAAAEKMAFGDGPQKVELERRGHDEEIRDDRLDREKGLASSSALKYTAP